MKTKALRTAIWMIETSWIVLGGLIPTLLLLRLPWPGEVTDTIANAAVDWLYHNYELIIGIAKLYTFLALVALSITLTWVITRRWERSLVHRIAARLPVEIPVETPRAKPTRRSATPSARKRKSLETT